MDQITEWLGKAIGIDADLVAKLLLTIGIVIALWLLRWVWTAIVNRRTDEPQSRYRWRKAASYTVTVVGILLIGRVWIEGIQTLVTYLGLVSAGIAIALRDPIVNWFGWVFIGGRRPFAVGDRVRIAGQTGDVIDNGMSTFSLLETAEEESGEQVTGRIVHIPNAKVFTEPLTNVTQGFSYVWNEIPITVTFESDWREAKRILCDIALREVEAVGVEALRWIREASTKFMIRSASVTPMVYTRIVSDGIELTVRYMCEARTRRTTQEALSEAILDAFIAAPKIDFAYRTSRIFRQNEEGKPMLNRDDATSGATSTPLS
jgi:small-conductance mechanosensitive channel